MPNFNSITIIGHIGRDAETNFLQSGKAVSKFSLAQNHKQKGETHTNWFDVTVWDKESLANHLTKGKAVLVHGELKIRTYDKKDGSKGTSVEVNARQIEFVGGRTDAVAATAGRSGQPPASGTEFEPGITDDEVPF